MLADVKYQIPEILSVKQRYIPQLDSFRFYAVLLVIFSHWLPFNKINTVPNGFLGVTFFFVLSGFLISSILIDTKAKIDSGSVTFWRAIRVFYIRRSLRIFPLYYLVIVGVFLLVPSIYSGNVIWYLTYASNFLLFSMREWPGVLSHFWSLAVEEQFYLIWPLIIFISPWRLLKYIFPAVIGISIIFKMYVFYAVGKDFNFYDALPISCFDSFGMGALLALNLANKEYSGINIFKVPFWPGLFISALISWLVYGTHLSFLFGTCVSVTAMFLVFGATLQFEGRMAFILNSPIIIYLGKISYGLYVYHNFVPWLLRCISGTEVKYPLPIGTISFPWMNRPLIVFIAQMILLIGISSISWILYERPVNNLKKYFN